MSEPNGWLTVKAYCARYSLGRTTLYKLAHFKLVTVKRITYPGQTKPIVRVENTPPRTETTTS